MDVSLSIFLLLYGISIPIFFLVDMVWLGVVARHFYAQQLGNVLGPVRWGVALAFYCLYVIGITIFATYPAFIQESIVVAVIYGALFGFFTYATYDLTNLATLRSWPTKVVVVDILWGTVLSAVVAGGTVAIALSLL